MMEHGESKTAESIMTIPKSILFNTLRDAIATREEHRISDLTDLLYANFELHTAHAAQGSENARRIDIQHQEIQSSIEMMREGFKNMEKRFDDLLHHMNKRFEAVEKRFEATDKRFDDLIHHMDNRFEAADKRFDDLIHHMDKRFEAVDKRFTVLTWMIGIGFVTMNTIMLIVKFTL